jgi:hypothetical protein
MKILQPKYKLGDKVKVAYDKNIVTGEIVGIAIDDHKWIRCGEIKPIYAVDLSTSMFSIKLKIFDVLNIDWCEKYKEYQIISLEKEK